MSTLFAFISATALATDNLNPFQFNLVMHIVMSSYVVLPLEVKN